MLIGRIKSEIYERSASIRAAFHPTAKLRERKFDEQFGFCAICGKELGGWDSIQSELDHSTSVYIWAECRNISIKEMVEQANDENNLVLVHPSCNKQKRERDLEEHLERIDAGETSLTLKIWTAEELEKEKKKLLANSSKGARKRNQLYGNPATPESCSKGGQSAGRKNVESGQIQALGHKHGHTQGRKNVESGQIQELGRNQGRKNVDSGQLAMVATPESRSKGGRKTAEKLGTEVLAARGRKLFELHGNPATPESCSKGGRIGGQISGRKAVESGHLARIRTHENCSKGASISLCNRWHKLRNKVHHTCTASWCREQRTAQSR
jgi:hypothetical protein